MTSSPQDNGNPASGSSQRRMNSVKNVPTES
jgi:hypothetical protein